MNLSVKRTFDMALDFVLEHEGGYVNDPDDPGGATNLGISFRFLKSANIDVNGDGIVNTDDIRDMTKDAAAQIYYERFWRPSGCDDMRPSLAVFTFDTAVNMGVGRAVKIVQECLGGIAVDGGFGPKTQERLREVQEKGGTSALSMKAVSLRYRHYMRIIGGNHALAKYARGWSNRVENLRELMRKA